MKKFVVMSIFKVNAPILQFLAPPAPAGQNCLKRLAKIVNKRPLQHQIIIFQNWYYSTAIGSDFAHCYKKKCRSPLETFIVLKSPFFWPNSLLRGNANCNGLLLNEKTAQVLCVYIEAINSPFYEHFLMMVELRGVRLDK